MASRKTVDLITANSEMKRKEYPNGEKEARDEEATIKKYIWFVLFKVLIVLILMSLYNTWQNFNMEPIFTNIDVNTKEQPIDFPSVFICPRDSVDHDKLEKFLAEIEMPAGGSKAILKECLVNLAQYSAKKSFLNCSRVKEGFPGFDVGHVLKKIMITCRDYIFNCTFKGYPFECCSNIYPMQTEKGHCFVFNNFNTNFSSSAHQIWSNEKNWQFAFRTARTEIDVNIYLKSFYDVLSFVDYIDFPWQNKKISLIKMRISQNFSTPEVRELELRYRECLFYDEKGPFKNLLGTRYNYDLCRNQCHLNAFLKACNCVPLFYQDIPLLGNKGISTCNLTQTMCVKDNLAGVTHQTCNCPKECNLTQYHIFSEHLGTQKSQADESIPLTIDLEAWPLKRYKNDVTFGWNKLTFPLGGIAGIFIGFSFLWTIQFIYQCLFRLCCILLMAVIFKRNGPKLSSVDPIKSISQITQKKVKNV